MTHSKPSNESTPKLVMSCLPSPSDVMTVAPWRKCDRLWQGICYTMVALVRLQYPERIHSLDFLSQTGQHQIGPLPSKWRRRWHGYCWVPRI